MNRLGATAARAASSDTGIRTGDPPLSFEAGSDVGGDALARPSRRKSVIPEPLNSRPHSTGYCALVMGTFYVAVRLCPFGMTLGQPSAHSYNRGNATTGGLRPFAGGLRPLARP